MRLTTLKRVVSVRLLRGFRQKLKDHDAEACGVAIVDGVVRIRQKLKDHDAEACGVAIVDGVVRVRQKLKDHDAEACGVGVVFTGGGLG